MAISGFLPYPHGPGFRRSDAHVLGWAACHLAEGKTSNVLKPRNTRSDPRRPQLHIIENRYRLERKIFQGRQAVRRAMHSKAQSRTETEAEAEPEGKVPRPITDTKIVSPALALTLSGGGESPVPADSDVEQAIVQGTPRPSYTRRSYSKTRKSSSQASGSPRVSATRSVARRRFPSTSNVAQAGDSDDDDEIPKIDYGRASPDPPPDREAEQQEPPMVQEPMLQAPQIPPSPSALFKRLRTTSFSPFASLRRSGLFGKDAAADPDARSVSIRMASSESSSDDDDLSVASRRVWDAFPLGDSHSDDEAERDRPSQDS